ncbi:MAG: FIST C-terminal domain-containing protein [Burkholderiales bacterium]|nr:FIST C-terminal domain-containing protein [Burkholderiales bacterium]
MPTVSTTGVTTGLTQSPRATPRLAAEAVEKALARLGASRAGQVLLFLSADFAHDPRPAIVAAARAAQTLAITGCTALGVMTEEDWVLDAPSACALVLPEQLVLDQQALLSLAAPNALDIGWLEQERPRYGGVAGDATGLGPFKVWRQGQIVPEGYADLPLPTAHIGLSRGLAPVGTIHRITAVDGFDLQTLDERQAATTLRRAIDVMPPAHQIALALVDDNDAVTESLPVVSINPDGAVTVAGRVQVGERVRWLHRSAETAQQEVAALVAGPAPDFALLFSCGARGPELHGGVDREWEMVRAAWPGVPFAGFYGNGQIVHQAGMNRLLHQSLVLASFGGKDI